jgi:hypothetical protein
VCEIDYSDAHNRLVEEERDVVVAALLKGFGGVSGTVRFTMEEWPWSSQDDSE